MKSGNYGIAIDSFDGKTPEDFSALESATTTGVSSGNTGTIFLILFLCIIVALFFKYKISRK